MTPCGRAAFLWKREAAHHALVSTGSNKEEPSATGCARPQAKLPVCPFPWRFISREFTERDRFMAILAKACNILHSRDASAKELNSCFHSLSANHWRNNCPRENTLAPAEFVSMQPALPVCYISFDILKFKIITLIASLSRTRLCANINLIQRYVNSMKKKYLTQIEKECARFVFKSSFPERKLQIYHIRSRAKFAYLFLSHKRDLKEEKLR